MNPPGVAIGAFHMKPQTVSLDDLRDVAVEKLRDLRGFHIGLAQHRCDRRDGGDALAQCSGQSTFAGSGVSGGSSMVSLPHLPEGRTTRERKMKRKGPVIAAPA